MKHEFAKKSYARAIATAAVATLLPLSAAHAAASGSIWIGDAKFADWIATGTPATASPFENGQYEKLNLAVIGDIAWVPKSRGVQGPVRTDPAAEEAARKQEADERYLRQRFGSVGMPGTF